jgi:hypothetical protein
MTDIDSLLLSDSEEEDVSIMIKSKSIMLLENLEKEILRFLDEIKNTSSGSVHTLSKKRFMFTNKF